MLVQGAVTPETVIALWGSAGAEVQAATRYAFGGTAVMIVVGRKFYFRSNDYLGVVCVTTTSGGTQRIDVSYAGGGSGMLGVQWGAGNDLEAAIELPRQRRVSVRRDRGEYAALRRQDQSGGRKSRSGGM